MSSPGISPEIEHRIDPGDPGDPVGMLDGPARDPESASAASEQARTGRETPALGQLAIELVEEPTTLGAAVRLADVDPRDRDPRGEELLMHPFLMRIRVGWQRRSIQDPRLGLAPLRLVRHEDEGRMSRDEERFAGEDQLLDRPGRALSSSLFGLVSSDRGELVPEPLPTPGQVADPVGLLLGERSRVSVRSVARS